MADATAKYGKPAIVCRASHVPPIQSEDVFELKLDAYEGGVALWGAVPPVYDTTELPVESGIHVHARRNSGDEKEIDHTYRAVRINGTNVRAEGRLVNELDAIYYMVASIFGYEMKQVVCTYCGYPHLDRDWFSVHPHRRHLCAACGRHFRDGDTAIGNPICGVREAFRIKAQNLKQSRKKLRIRQADFRSGIQIWGSNRAFIWTGRRNEQEGIHIHAFKNETVKPDIDDTYGEVVIDGVKLDASMVRTLMAQSALPHVAHRVVSINCPSCAQPQFSTGELRFTPVAEHRCNSCGRGFVSRGRLRKTIANPLPAVLEQLARFAPKQRRTHTLDLLPETL